MEKNEHGIRVIDLFCGAGGFSEGFHQAGFDVVVGIDNWKPACSTHTINGLGETRNIDLLRIDVDGILSLKADLEKTYGKIDIIIGSPPCTEFSYAKNAGHGDIEKGMILVRRNLLFVALFKPRYWLMENVPRLETVLDKECVGSRETGWSIRYEKLGIPRNRFAELGLSGDSLRIPNGTILVASDFGTHQNRKRFIAGDFPSRLMEEQKINPGTDVSLGRLLGTLERNLKVPIDQLVSDPNYPYYWVKRSEIRDYDYDTSLHPMYWEEMRHLKRRNIQYGRMHLPEDLNAPARTIMATYNPSSRESLILETEKTTMYHGRKRSLFRQPNVREVACIQGFPLNFQLVASEMSERYKLIGNAVPCQLSYALAKAISQDISQHLSELHDEDFLERAKITLERQKANNNRPIISKPKELVGEAIGTDKVNRFFRAKFTKHIRRKILSSALKGNSCVVILENSNFSEGHIEGGPFWKSCIQKGVGKSYHQVYLDEVSVSQIVGSMNTAFKVEERKALLRCLFDETDKGMPVLNDDWEEFPGWSKDAEPYLSLITKKRLKLPSVTMFQRAFTEDIEDIGEHTSPIDFFDGLDAIMLSVFCRREFRNLQDSMVYVGSLRDSGKYPHRLDPRIIPRLDNTSIPLVTIMSGLLSVDILRRMYENDASIGLGGYPVSLETAEKMMIAWCS